MNEQPCANRRSRSVKAQKKDKETESKAASRNLEGRSQGSSTLSRRRDVPPVRSNARNLGNTKSNSNGSSILSGRKDLRAIDKELVNFCLRTSSFLHDLMPYG
ncbi:hypothetical protein JTB14_025541 [Gonioctena quinquepunctata]|nr:hypothetical protein JTB14_025541 [Gonioctena quinquepunctata]